MDVFSGDKPHHLDFVSAEKLQVLLAVMTENRTSKLLLPFSYSHF